MYNLTKDLRRNRLLIFIRYYFKLADKRSEFCLCNLKKFQIVTN